MNDERRLSLDRPAVDISLLVMRVVVGVTFAAHGAAGGRGFDGCVGHEDPLLGVGVWE